MDCKSGGMMAAFAASLVGCAVQRGGGALPDLPASFERQQPVAVSPMDGSVFAAFGSRELDELIAAAEPGSADLAAAVARVRQADARAHAAGAALLPEVDLTSGATQFGGGSHGATAHETDWSSLLTASYEMDFWGRNRATRAAALALAQATRADLATARITLLTSVANLYFKVQSLRERIAIARANLNNANDVLKFMAARLDAGEAAPAELAAQRAVVANCELAIPALEQQEVEALGALAVLVGRVPEGFAPATEPLDSLREPAIAAGIPAALLERRPDLLAAEHQLRAAHADVAAARAALFPSLTLTAGAGIANPAVQAAVITLAGTGYSLTAGADVVQAIFDHGRRRALTREAAAREQELLAQYRGAIYGALTDVENALAEIGHLDAQRQAQQDYLAASQRAFDGAQLRYQAGAADYVSVLESQHLLYAAREQFGEYTLSRLQAFLGLNKALGGAAGPVTDAASTAAGALTGRLQSARSLP